MTGMDTGLQRLVEALNQLQVPFYVAGSLASGVHGIYRTTVDIDLVAAIRPHHVPALAAELGKEFYVDADMIQDALRRGRSFNLIHFASAYKFDIFPLKEDVYQHTEFERRKVEKVSLGGEATIEVPVASAEDTVLNKLAWYRAGGETSERQWNDVRGILAVQREKLDREYLRHWARYLKIGDLLEQALSQAGLGS